MNIKHMQPQTDGTKAAVKLMMSQFNVHARACGRAVAKGELRWSQSERCSRVQSSSAGFHNHH